MMCYRFKLPLLVCLVALLATTGCGKKTGEVTGTVTFKGKPLPAGKIVFTGAKNRTGSGDIVDGKFTVAAAPVGDDIKVTIDTQAFTKMLTMQQQQEQLIRQRLPNYDEIKKKKFSDLPPDIQEVLKEAHLDPESLKQMKTLKENIGSLNIPPEMGLLDKTPITVKVSSGSQEIDIDLDKYK
jgi:hypothetical protein